MSISFEDFLLFTKAPEVDQKVFATIAPGVIDYIKDTYGIFLERDTSYVYKYFMRAKGTTLILPISPINSITSIKVEGSTADFTYYGDDIVLTVSTTDARQPVEITMDIGYINIPGDLKLAVYQHIENMYFRHKNSVDSIDKVLNSTGSTTYFSPNTTPPFSQAIYDKYSNRVVALY